ncbi:transmembrane protease serine 11D-like isoform X3 [Macrobrachium nipponense]|uniref:transmembrane protease serine 11D-like isoform X3 n=1 Tax=Macrobrachium nipponense TaxID=159736 RepID=UPI0030C8159F
MHAMIPMRCWIVIALISGALMASLTSLAIAESAKVMNKWKRTGILVGGSADASNPTRSARIGCGNIYYLIPGEDRIVRSINGKGEIFCRTKFTSENSRVGIFCPKFLLHKRGCSMESMKITGGKRKKRYCAKDVPDMISTGKSLAIYYKRKKCRQRKCRNGFVCRVYALQATPAPPEEGECGWTERLSQGIQKKIRFATDKRKRKRKQKKSETGPNKKKRKQVKMKTVKTTEPEKQTLQETGIDRRRRLTTQEKGEGRKDKSLDNRIVGGIEALPGEYPWAVVFMKATQNGSVSGFCGGSLVSSSWIISAAHCFNYVANPLDVLVMLGRCDLPDSSEGLLKIVEVIIHPEFSPRSDFSNDLSLVKLEKPVGFTSSIIPICLATLEDDPLPSNATVVVGWGHTQSGGSWSRKLQSVSVAAISLEECQTLYEGTFVITPVMLCAYSPGKDACQGDSGGGLVRLASDGRWVLVGIVSFGKGCAEDNAPGVYARVSSFNSWISEITSS